MKAFKFGMALGFALVLSTPLSAFAAKKTVTGDDAEAIYNALKIVSVSPYTVPAAGGGSQEKKVGQLKCFYTYVCYPGAKPQFSCSMDDDLDPKAIFEALTTEAVSVDSEIAGHYKRVKSVGSLRCSESGLLGTSEPLFSCEFLDT